MDYSQFLRLHERDWEDFGRRLADARQHSGSLDYDSLERLALAYRQVLQDHALASWRFPGTGAARRLARLAIEGTRWLHGARDDRRHSLRRFWTRTFPLAFRGTARSLAITVSVFFVAALFGFFLAMVQTRLAVSLLGPSTGFASRSSPQFFRVRPDSWPKSLHDQMESHVRRYQRVLSAVYMADGFADSP